MADEHSKEPAEVAGAEGLIPIETIHPAPESNPSQGPVIPQTLSEDPDTGDGSAGREGVEVFAWRLRTLTRDRLGSMAEPSGRDAGSRKARRERAASRKARSSKRRTSRGRARIAVAVLLAVLVAGVATAGVTYALEQWGGKTVPNVVGMSQSAACAQLVEKGFSVVVGSEPSDTVEGHVVSVTPAEGERVPEGTKVRLTVSEARIIPNVLGMSRSDAEAALERVGAKNIHFESRIVLKEEDSVVEVVPPAGSAFMSSDEVRLVISQLPRVPDVVGEERAVALATLEREGLAAQVRYERAGEDQRFSVVRTEPAAGEVVEEGQEVTMIVGDPLVNAVHVVDYFEAPAPHIDEFLREEGFEPKLGYRTQDGHVVASYVEGDTTVCFAAQPWLHALDRDKTAYTPVMGENARIEGVRLTATLANAAYVTGSPRFAVYRPSVSEQTLRDVMEICGFANVQGFCTPTTIKLPKGAGNARHEFYCCYGQERTCTWTILVKQVVQDDKSSVVKLEVTCAPRASYATIDLSDYGNNVGDFVAYHEEYNVKK